MRGRLPVKSTSHLFRHLDSDHREEHKKSLIEVENSQQSASMPGAASGDFKGEARRTETNFKNENELKTTLSILYVLSLP